MLIILVVVVVDVVVIPSLSSFSASLAAWNALYDRSLGDLYRALHRAVPGTIARQFELRLHVAASSSLNAFLMI